MDIQTTKLNVVQKVLGVTNISLLEKINELLNEELTVGYTVSGEPLTAKEYNKRLEIAEEQIRNGNYISQEDLEEESDNW